MGSGGCGVWKPQQGKVTRSPPHGDGFLMTEGRGGGLQWRRSLTRRMELTDSVMWRRLISVSSLRRSQAGRVQGPAPSPAARPPNGSQPRRPYTSFLCFSRVLASEILLWRFLSRIFCSSFFSLEEPVGVKGRVSAGLGALPLSWRQGVHRATHTRPSASTCRSSPSAS